MSDSSGLVQLVKSVLTVRQIRVCAALWFDQVPALVVGVWFGMSERAVWQMSKRARMALRNAGVELPRRFSRQSMSMPAEEAASSLPADGRTLVAEGPDPCHLAGQIEEMEMS